MKNINHESVDMLSNSEIKLTDYRIIKASNSAETARAGVVMECKILPKYTDLYRPSHVIWEHTFFTISTKNV